MTKPYKKYQSKITSALEIIENIFLQLSNNSVKYFSALREGVHWDLVITKNLQINYGEE